jgi:hypothetical protein
VPSNLDSEIDRVYQLSLSEFTEARNALAKTAGARAAEIKKLQKPNAPAWAVNQLYWHDRKIYDRLIAAAERLRAAHAKRISGQNADIPAVETAHRAALDAAMNAARAHLERAGESATPATLTAVTETLDALPGAEPPGRLTRPLKPGGFEVLAGLLSGAPKRPGRPAEVVPFERKRDDAAASEKARAKEAAAALAKEAAKLEKQVTTARETEREAESALGAAKKSLERVDQLTTDVKRLQHRADASSVDRKRLQDQLARLSE